MNRDSTWPHGPQPTLAPMTLGANGCPGQVRSKNDPRAVGLCYGCTLYGHQGPVLIQPAAQKLDDGTWFCHERRSLGVVPVAPVPAPGVSCVHGSDSPPIQGGSTPLGLGPAPIGGNAGGGVIA